MRRKKVIENPILAFSKLDTDKPKERGELLSKLNNGNTVLGKIIANSTDDILLYNLKPGFTVALADGHDTRHTGVVSGGIMDLFEKKLDTYKDATKIDDMPLINDRTRGKNDSEVTQNMVGAKDLSKTPEPILHKTQYTMSHTPANQAVSEIISQHKPETFDLLNSQSNSTVHNRNNKKEQSEMPLELDNIHNTPCNTTTKISPGAVCKEGDRVLYQEDIAYLYYGKPEMRLGNDFLIRSSPVHACEDTLIATEETGLNIPNMFHDAAEQFNDKKEGSTLTIAELDQEGNLKFGILGDSPVYLIVNDAAGKEKVIKLSADMDMIPGEWKDGTCVYKHTTRYSQYGTGIDGFEVAGAIGDADVRKRWKNRILSSPEYYDFSKGTEYTTKLNEFLKKIGVQDDINDLLKSGAAKVVVGSDGLDSGKLRGLWSPPQSVHDYELRFANQTDFLNFDKKFCESALYLPPGNISFDGCSGKKLEKEINPILYVSKLDKLTKEQKVALKDPEGYFYRTILNSKDDILLYNLKPGFTVALADGHGEKFTGVVSGGIMDLFETRLDTYKDATKVDDMTLINDRTKGPVIKAERKNDIKVTEKVVASKETQLLRGNATFNSLDSQAHPVAAPRHIRQNNEEKPKSKSETEVNIHNINNTPCNANIRTTYNLHYGIHKTSNANTKSDGIKTHKNLEAESSKIGIDIKALDKESFLAEFREKFIDNTSYYATKLLKTLQKNDKPLHEIFKHSSRLDYLKDDPEKELELKNECIALLSKKVQLFETSYTHDRF